MKRKKHFGNTRKEAKPADSFLIENDGLLLATLYQILPSKKKNLLKAVLRDKQVRVNGKTITQFDYQLKKGSSVEVRWEKTTQQERPHGLKIIFEDDDLIIIDKPSGLLTVATDKEKRKTAYAILSSYVKEAHPDNKIFIIHRIDRETSGLLMFAKNEAVKEEVQKNWTSTVSDRTYVAVVEGPCMKPEGTVVSYLYESKAFIVYSSQNPEHGQRAVTHYKMIKETDEFSLLQINLETGRKHQIRVHMQDLKHPIIGDKKYGSRQNPIRQLALHAQVLAFKHPITKEECRFETPIPGKFLHLFAAKKD